MEAVLKSLKKNKSRDPNGWINELFTYGVLGNDLKISLLYIFNRIKQENRIPDFIRLADVSTIYKGKGAKNELVNERGIFVVPIMRNIPVGIAKFAARRTAKYRWWAVNYIIGFFFVFPILFFLLSLASSEAVTGW